MLSHVPREGKGYGPYSLAAARGYLARGALSAGDLAWYEGLAGVHF